MPVRALAGFDSGVGAEQAAISATIVQQPMTLRMNSVIVVEWDDEPRKYNETRVFGYYQVVKTPSFPLP